MTVQPYVAGSQESGWVPRGGIPLISITCVELFLLARTVHGRRMMVLVSNTTDFQAPDLPGISFKRVLCWVNSTAVREWTAELAFSLAASCNGSCHVVMCLDCASRPGNPVQKGNGPLTPELISAACNDLANLYGDDMHTMVLPGNPIAEIRRYARTKEMDLIVMGKQGLAVESLYGEQLYKDAPCTVMVLVMPEDNPTSNDSRTPGKVREHER